MKRMTLYILVSVAGLTVCGLLVLRHACRTAPLMPPTSDLPAPPPRPLQPVDRWQGGIGVDTRTDCQPDPAATKRLMEKLRQEERRQRPLEGRN